MKCLVIETSNARPYSAAHPVTNEDGTPHVYATMTEARAELRANGYSYNREARRYYIKGTKALAYIVREDSEQYAEAIEQAEQQAAPEYIEPEHTLKTYPTAREAYAAGAAGVVEVITHETAARAFAAAAEAAQAIPAAHNRKRVDARTAAIDAVVEQAARYADATEAAAHIAGQPTDYLHRHTVNLGTRRWSDYRAEYEQYWRDSLILHGTASKTGKSVNHVSLVHLVLVID